MQNTVYDFKLTGITGNEINLGDFSGKKILLVNTASACGLTPQYAQLQELHELHNDKLQIIGLPCNDFGAQEPGSETEVKQFCETHYSVTFPLTSKIKVLGQDAHPLYKFLTQKELNGLEDSEVKWNFQKYLIDENGYLQKVFSPMTTPLDEEILKAVGIV
jgi:glutathione peroxidase